MILKEELKTEEKVFEMMMFANQLRVIDVQESNFKQCIIGRPIWG